MAVVHEGGCLCGAVRYRLTAQPTGVGYCHCSMCRKSASAPAMVFGSVPNANFLLDRGEDALRRYKSSDIAERAFCGTCGSQLLFDDSRDPDRIDVSIATLDRPEAVTPEFHIWVSSRIEWFDTTDHLPRYPTSDRPR